MRPRNCSSFSEMFISPSESPIKEEYEDDIATDRDESDGEEYICDCDEFDEVFADHLLMEKRLLKSLYAGNMNDLEPPVHPPIALTGLALELFSKAVPNDGLDILDMDYVSCVSEATHVTPCAMIVAMIYLERLQLKNTEYLEMVSPTGLFVVTMMVASKFLFEDVDDGVTIETWALGLDFEVDEIKKLEREFLAAIDWKVFVSSSDYFNYLCKIEKIIATRQSSLRNWLSYGDICSIFDDKMFETFWAPCFERIIKVMVLWTVGYVATALTLHNASFALSKLLEGKCEPKSLSRINSTLELQNHAHSVAKSFNNTLTVDNMDDFLMIPLLLESSAEQESENAETVKKYDSMESDKHQTNYYMCDASNFKRKYLKSGRKLKLQMLNKLKTTLTSISKLESILINDSYNYSGTNSGQYIDCFSLLM